MDAVVLDLFGTLVQATIGDVEQLPRYLAEQP